jgi:MIP family channel proteins
MNIAKFLAEFIGTFALTFIGAGSICLNAFNPGSVGLPGIAAAHGLALGVMVSAFGHISGGKINPAVSLGLVAGGKSDIKTAGWEILAQVSGAIVAALCLKLIFPSAAAEEVHLGTPALGEGITPFIGIFAETILTFFLVLTVFATAIDKHGAWRAIAGLGIGLVVLFDILAFGGITGAAMNPARAFGPALIGNFWDAHYVYWIGPIIGGLIAGVLYSRVFLSKDQR